MSTPIQLQYSDEGGGMPIVLLHGFPLSSAIWHEQQRALTGLYRVITPDLRGHGKSIAPAGIYTMDVLAGDVLALLDRLEVETCVLMGHSMGGYVALALYQMQPDRFTALGLISTQANADTDEARQGRAETVERVLLSGQGSRTLADLMLPRLFSTAAEPDAELYEEVQKIIMGTSVTAIVGSLKGMAARPDSMAAIAEIQKPVLVLNGDHDVTIPPERSEAMSAVIPLVTHIVIEDAGHLPMMEQPGATTEAIKTFLGTL
jgi:pimeloyl-ACP methyl ester carboxylesterase